MSRPLAACASVALLFVSCQQPRTGPSATPTPQSEERQIAVRVTPAPELTDDYIVQALGASGLPISDVRVFTSDTDPDRALGRPNQYTGKVAWRDARVAADATLEIFPTLASLEARKRLVEARNSRDGTLTEYIVERAARRALMRLPRALTPEQAREYEDWFERL